MKKNLFLFVLMLLLAGLVLSACGGEVQQAVEEVAPTVAAAVEEKAGNTGFDANTAEYVDMIKAGIVDPTKVTRCALQNAASIAGLLLTTEVMVTEYDDDEDAEKIEGAVV